MQEEQISDSGHILRLTIDDENKLYGVDVIKMMETVFLGFDNPEDARELYRILQKLNSMTAHCCGEV